MWIICIHQRRRGYYIIYIEAIGEQGIGLIYRLLAEKAVAIKQEVVATVQGSEIRRRYAIALAS